VKERDEFDYATRARERFEDHNWPFDEYDLTNIPPPPRPRAPAWERGLKDPWTLKCKKDFEDLTALIKWAKNLRNKR